MGIRHSETSDRVALEVEFDQHDGLLAHDPTVMARFDRHNLRSSVFHNAPVGVFDVDFAARQEADVGMHTQIGPDNGFHVHRPAKSAWVDHPLDACSPGASDLEPDVADCAALGALHGLEERIPPLGSAHLCLTSFRDRSGAPGILSGGLFLCHVSLFDERNGRC